MVTLKSDYLEVTAGKEPISAARVALEKSLADVSKQRDELIGRIDTMAAELSGAKQEHGLAFAALDRDRGRSARLEGSAGR